MLDVNFLLLVELYINSNHIKYIDSLENSNFPELRILELEYNEINNLKKISKLRANISCISLNNKVYYKFMEELDLSDNYIKNISFLLKLNKFINDKLNCIYNIELIY